MAQKAKKSKRPDNRPARARYWASKRLLKNKVRNLMKNNGFESEAEAKSYWLSVRVRHKNILNKN